MDNTALDEALKFFADEARVIKEKSLANGDDFPGMLFVLTEDDHVTQIPLRWHSPEEKAHFKRLMPYVLQKLNALATIMVVDAHFLQMKDGYDPEIDLPPSKHPDAKQVLLVAVRSWGYHKQCHMPYEVHGKQVQWAEYEAFEDATNAQDSFTDDYFAREVQ